jgi:voltage-gated potassium channel Kch
LSDFETAFYFAFTSYTTVGYGDVVLERPWRILGTIAAADGYLMFGLSTAVLFAILQQVIIVPHFQPGQNGQPAPAASDGPRSSTEDKQKWVDE